MKRAGGILACALSLSACAGSDENSPPQPQQAGQPSDPAKTAAHILAAQAGAIVGDREAVQANAEAMADDMRRSMRLPDAARPIDREAARIAAKRVDGVRSAVWINRDNLLAMVTRNELRSQATIDAICLQLEPLGDTLAVVVNLQSAAAVTGDQLEILSRNCQLAPGDRAMLQSDRQIDALAPEVRAQHRANQALGSELDSEEAKRRQEESLRILEKTTPEM